MPFKRGAPMGNQNRRVHDLYSREMNERRAAIHRRKRIVHMVLARVAIVALTREALAGKIRRARALPKRKPAPTVIRKPGQMPRFRKFELLPPPRWRRLRRFLRRANDPFAQLMRMLRE